MAKNKVKTCYILRHKKFIWLFNVQVFPRNEFKWIDPKGFDLNKYTSNSSRGCFFDFDLEYPKELIELYIDYPLAPYKLLIILIWRTYQQKRNVV